MMVYAYFDLIYSKIVFHILDYNITYIVLQIFYIFKLVCVLMLLNSLYMIQWCIHLIKKYNKNHNIVKYYNVK